MNPKRQPLRQHFESEAQKALSIKQYNQRTAQLNALEDTVIRAFNTLIKFMDGKVTKTEVTNQLKSISTPDVDKVVKALSKLDADVLANKIDTKPLEKLLAGVQREVSLIPKTHAKPIEQKDSIKVTNLDEVKLDVSEVTKAIKELKLDPKIETKAPIVNVEQTDLKPLQDVMLDMLKALKNQKYPEFPEIPATDLSGVEKRLDKGNDHLKQLQEIFENTSFGGGGGGGNSTPYTTPAGNATFVQLEEDGSIPVSNDLLENMIDELASLVNSLRFLQALQTTDSSLRSSITGGSLGSVTTVTTLTNQTNAGGFGMQHQVMNQMNTNAAIAIRANIKVA